MSVLKRVAAKLARPSDEARLVDDPASRRAQYALIFIIAAMVAFLLVPVTVSELRQARKPGPQIRVDSSEWRVAYGRSPESCAELVRETEGCLANPENTRLWSSPHSKTDPKHKIRIQEMEGREFWLGLTIPVEVLTQARKSEMNQLWLGHIKASYRVWLDGEFIMEGGLASSELPAVVPVPLGRLQEPKPLKVAIQVNHDAESAEPDLLGGEQGEGFTTLERVQYQTYHVMLWNEVRPWSLFCMHLLLTGLFLFLWSGASRRPEYLYLAAYALVHAAVQFLELEVSRRWFGVRGSLLLVSVLRVYDGAFGMFAALAFARTRRAVFTWGVPVALILPWVLAAFPQGAAEQGERLRLITHAVMPLLYGVGAIACVAQGWYLKTHPELRATTGERVWHLTVFAGLWLAQGSLFQIETHSLVIEFLRALISLGFGFLILSANRLPQK